MSIASVNVNLKKAAYIQATTPNTHYSASAGTSYRITGTTSDGHALIMVFDAVPSNVKRKALRGVQITAQFRRGTGYHVARAYLINDYSYNIDTVTWNTRPGLLNKSFSFEGGSGQWENMTRPNPVENDSSGVWSFCAIRHGIYLNDPSAFSTSDDSQNWYAKTNLANNSPAYVTLYYDTDINITSKIVAQLPSGTNSYSTMSPLLFAWTYQSADSSNYCADRSWKQASATLYWKASDESTWHTINVSNASEERTAVDTMRYTYNVPAYTFPAGKTINWYLQGTDTDGTTTSTSTFNFSTLGASLTAISYPSGSNVDSRVGIPFSWNITEAETSASFTQTSAKLYWRVSGASSYNQINVSGNTKNVTVPAYTFPPNTTIEWYLSATVPNNFTYTNSPATFKTQAFSISIISAPTGSNVDTRSAISFSWKIANASGDAAQTSAKFYWRVSGAASYTQVSVSGGTKSVSIPANTFPTGKTIQWYVAAIVQGGTTLSTSAATFSTVSTQITMDTYPSGSNIYTAAGIRFTWHLASAVGNYNQSSAKLYWRSSTSATYTQISVSGNTQSLTVPANTFPTGKTIQWYIEATDIGGLTSTTSVLSFTTVTTQITPQGSPTSGYADPRYAITFQWYFASTGGAVPQGSATFYWRETGGSTWTSVAASGSTTKVTIPANTFPVGSSIDWYVSGTDVGGTSSTSATYTFSTTASTAYAYPQAPIGIAADTSKPLTLSWILANADGTQPSKVTLQWKKTTDLIWTTIRQSTTAFTEWTVAGNFFPIGEIEWRVIATNRDNVDGPAGTAAFVSVHAPAAPIGVSAEPVPRTTISWQGADQEGYEIIIDGETVKQAYGTDTVWQPDFVLEDGTHVISVRIQGPYGLWSEPGITTVAIENIVPEGWEDLSVSGSFAVDAVMTAAGAESLTEPTINWFRDGKRIAVTEGLRSYTDRYVLGEHSYRIEIWNSDGYYARSETITGKMKSCISRIALFSGGDWIDLKLSERSDNEQVFSYGKVSSLRHVLGAVYPVLEVSTFEDESGSYNCAFTDVQSARRFEGLRGQHVILKSRGGIVMIGALLSMEKRYTEFYINYSFTIQAIDWEDFRHVYAND